MKKLFLLSAILFSLQIFAQDYWSKVPAFPAVCYSQDDGFIQKVDALRDELSKKIDEEKKKVQSRFENMSDAEKQKMAMEMSTKYMSMTPDEIMEMQNASMKQMELSQAAQEAGTPVMDRYNELEAAYRSDRQRDLDPLTTEAHKLPDGEGTPDWVIKRGEELSKEYAQKYQVICAKYFTGSDALFKKWLAEFKQYTIDYTIPVHKSNYAAGMQQYGILNAETPAAEWEGIQEYLKYCRSVFQLREQHQ